MVVWLHGVIVVFAEGKTAKDLAVEMRVPDYLLEAGIPKVRRQEYEKKIYLP